jgi:CubicO group peptidase (beta-lactamase class C family)
LHGAALALGVLGCLGGPARADDLKAGVDAVVRPFLKDKDYLGVVVAVVRPGGRQVFGYGKVTLEDKSVVPDGSTVFEIGSITKVFTGTLLAELVREGNVKLEDPAQKYLPGDLKLPREVGREITLLDLATHTSGLPRLPTDLRVFVFTTPFKDWGNPYSHYGRPQLSRNLGLLKLNHQIGTTFEYSNLGVGVLGHALAHAARADGYEDLLAQRVLRPLRMTDTRIHLSAAQRARLAPGHDRDGDTVAAWDFASLEAAGALRSTADDMLGFVSANLGQPRTPLLPALLDARRPRRDTDVPGERVGLCWLITPLPGLRHPVVWHNGGTGGSSSYLGLVPATGTAVVVLSNSAHSVDKIGHAVLKRLNEKK